VAPESEVAGAAAGPRAGVAAPCWRGVLEREVERHPLGEVVRDEAVRRRRVGRVDLPSRTTLIDPVSGSTSTLIDPAKHAAQPRKGSIRVDRVVLPGGESSRFHLLSLVK